MQRYSIGAPKKNRHTNLNAYRSSMLMQRMLIKRFYCTGQSKLSRGIAMFMRPLKHLQICQNCQKARLQKTPQIYLRYSQCSTRVFFRFRSFKTHGQAAENFLVLLVTRQVVWTVCPKVTSRNYLALWEQATTTGILTVLLRPVLCSGRFHWSYDTI